MKIAAITITYNDGFKFQEWVGNYKEYKDEIYKHIIIDNSSEPEYLSMVKSTFTESIIIERKTNGGCTIAYNDGIREALSDANVDAIMLIGSDIRIPNGNISSLYNYLYSDDKLGMVSPIILKKDSDIIEAYGCDLTPFYIMDMLDKGKKITDIKAQSKYVKLVLGGMNLSKRLFYEKIGLQDETLFMYGDEQDIYERSCRSGFKMGATCKSVSWHNHINPPGQQHRHVFASVLSARNYIYLGRKHKSGVKLAIMLCYFIALTSYRILKNPFHKESVIYYLNSFKGLWYGLSGNMSIKSIHIP